MSVSEGAKRPEMLTFVAIMGPRVAFFVAKIGGKIVGENEVFERTKGYPLEPQKLHFPGENN